ncbi:hypothetical protein B0H17DRAFT_1144359 [Mycena rosella]|uniref:Uncharacterized protein n=1 Tax=Mycena rosella TaxID=1033263 RepID=A0AAD7CSV7_MYCRO|nr:hypothetical protein B0H17DRAFT_1144359 [Mycena rosella]
MMDVAVDSLERTDPSGSDVLAGRDSPVSRRYVRPKSGNLFPHCRSSCELRHRDVVRVPDNDRFLLVTPTATTIDYVLDSRTQSPKKAARSGYESMERPSGKQPEVMIPSDGEDGINSMANLPTHSDSPTAANDNEIDQMLIDTLAERPRRRKPENSLSPSPPANTGQDKSDCRSPSPLQSGAKVVEHRNRTATMILRKCSEVLVASDSGKTLLSIFSNQVGSFSFHHLTFPTGKRREFCGTWPDSSNATKTVPANTTSTSFDGCSALTAQLSNPRHLICHY